MPGRRPPLNTVEENGVQKILFYAAFNVRPEILYRSDAGEEHGKETEAESNGYFSKPLIHSTANALKKISHLRQCPLACAKKERHAQVRTSLYQHISR